MTEITDDVMRERIARTRDYTLVLLHSTGEPRDDAAERIVWEHGRRNFQLREQGLLSIVCPCRDETNLSGIGIFNASPEEVTKIMDADPGVQAGVFTYEIHTVRSFPGDALPA